MWRCRECYVKIDANFSAFKCAQQRLTHTHTYTKKPRTVKCTKHVEWQTRNWCLHFNTAQPLEELWEVNWEVNFSTWDHPPQTTLVSVNLWPSIVCNARNCHLQRNTKPIIQTEIFRRLSPFTEWFSWIPGLRTNHPRREKHPHQNWWLSSRVWR